jgi:hypothetical protein
LDWMPAAKIGQAIHVADGPFTDLLGTLEWGERCGPDPAVPCDAVGRCRPGAGARFVRRNPDVRSDEGAR